MSAEENLQLLAAIEAHRRFLLLACRDTPALLASADIRIRELLIPDLAERRFLQSADRPHE